MAVVKSWPPKCPDLGLDMAMKTTAWLMGLTSKIIKRHIQFSGHSAERSIDFKVIIFIKSMSTDELQLSRVESDANGIVRSMRGIILAK